MYNLLDPAQYPWGQPTAGLKKVGAAMGAQQSTH